MLAVRPQIEKTVRKWLKDSTNKQSSLNKESSDLRFRWSPLFETSPIGGPSKQPDFINAVLVVDGSHLQFLKPLNSLAIDLLKRFLSIEKQFGRDRGSTREKWGPRSLDIDLLWWGDLQVKEPQLILPHPRLIERSFVITPLAAALSDISKPHKRLPPQMDWPE